VAIVTYEGTVTAIAVGNATITATAGNKKATCTVTVADPAITDIGVVINGVTWATRNVDEPGTFAESPAYEGRFYQWNRRTAYPAIGVDWDNSLPTGDTWETANDPSPAGWRVPTYSEIVSLLDASKVTHEWVTNGRLFTDKTTGASLFLPAAGWLDFNYGSSEYSTRGNYWSSEPYGATGAYQLLFAYNSGYLGIGYDNANVEGSRRSYGFSIRSVAGVVVAVANVSLDKTTLKLAGGDSTTLTATVTPNNATDKIVRWTSSDNRIATVDNRGKVICVSAGEAVITAKAGDKTATCALTVTANPADGVVINGVLWAKCNVDYPGTFARRPEDRGKHYQWNGGYTNPNGSLNWNWGSSSSSWETAIDPSPAGWRVPTKEELETLLDASKVTNERVSGGMKFTDLITGNTLFLPACGYLAFFDASWYSSDVIYWSSTAAGASGSIPMAYCLNFENVTWYAQRCGIVIRSVAK
jgi:uncharacterized protein (TIGR02145 family)